MKRLLLLSIAILSFTQVSAQMMDLDDLLKVIKQSKDLGALDDSLQSNGWEYDGGSGSLATWEYREGEILLATLLVSRNDLRYTFPSAKELYDFIKGRAEYYNMEKINSEALEEGIRTAYMGKNYVLRTMAKKKDWGTIYFVNLFTKDEYELTLITERVFKNMEREGKL